MPARSALHNKSAPARRLSSAPAAQPTPFADAALVLRDHGLAPVPLGGDDGKVPLVRWRPWKRPPGRQLLERLAGKHPTANIGVLTGLSGLTVVDADDPELVDGMLSRFGDTPLITGTPSGGVHLWYRSTGERCRTRLDGLKVDIRGLGGMVVVPPSIRPTGQHAGKVYTFVKGSWDDLVHLPTVTPGALKAASHVDPPAPHLEPYAPFPAPLAPHLEAVPDGRRGESLLLACLDQAPYCGTSEHLGVSVHLLDVARTINADYLPPLSDAEVVKTARSAWGYETRGENWRGYRGHGAHVVVDVRLADRLLAFDPGHGPDALALYVKLQATHGGRVARGETFAVAARAMAHQVLPWPEYRIRIATETLANFGLLQRVHEGGTGPGDAAQYTFRSPPPALVSEMNTNVTKHPPPGSLGGG